MRQRLFFGMLIFALTAFAADKMQRLNVKTGLWEVTTTMSTQGETPVPAELLQRLTPEQRARMEARMKAQPAGRSRTTTEKNCLTEEDLAKGDSFSKNPNQECTQKI